jgi:hypothetical protein
MTRIIWSAMLAAAVAAIATHQTIAEAQGRGGGAGQPNPQVQAEFQRNLAFGVKHRTAWDLYMALKAAAAGGGRVNVPYNQLPDWSGLWRAGGGGGFVNAVPGGPAPKLTAAALAKLKENGELAAKGAAYQENISDCGPPGYPMWLNIPFLREFIVRPEQTWLSSETVNNVRRIYTDGRAHPTQDEAFPLYYGDSIGFWDNQKLVIHTAQLMARSLAGRLNQSEQMETVEIWEKTAPGTVEAKVWIYDPAIYLEPWYTTRRYNQVDNPAKVLRMNYWHCGENANNEVFRTPEGSTQYKDFQFTDQDNSK